MAQDLFSQIALQTLGGIGKSAAPGQSAIGGGDDPVSAIFQVAQERGIDPAHLLGLAKLETRAGEKTIKGDGTDTRNLFNVKDFSTAGTGIRARDNAEGSNDRYRQYGSYRESAEDLVGLLERKYPAALKAKSPEEFAQALKAGGYATDPLYERKLANTIRSSAGSLANVRPVQSAQEWDQGARYIPMDLMLGGTDKPQPAEEGVVDGVASLGKAVWQGAKSLGRSVMASGNTAVGDLSDVELLAEAQKVDAKNNPRAMQALQQEIAKRKEANPDAAWWQALGDVGDAAWQNKLGTAQLILNQAPNSAVALGGGWAGGVAGAKIGALAAPFTGGLSVPVGATVGALAGMFLGNYAMESGGKAIEKAEGGFTTEEARQSMTEGAKKAAVVTGVDAATLGAGKLVGRTVFGAPVRAGARAEAQVLANAGVDITNKAAIAQALATNQALKQAAIEAGKQAAQDASKWGTRAAQAGTGLTMETLGEGVGEYYGEMAATGKGDVYDAALEALSSATQSVPQTAMAMRSSSGNDLDPSGIVRAAKQSGGIVSRAGLAATAGAQQPAGQPGQPNQPNQAGATTTTAGSTAAPVGSTAAAPNPYFADMDDEGLKALGEYFTDRQTMTDGAPITNEDRKLGQDALAELARRQAAAATKAKQQPAAAGQNPIQASALSAIEQALEADKQRRRLAGEVVDDDVTDVEVKAGTPPAVAPTAGPATEADPMLPKAIDVLRQGGRPSVSQIQRQLKIGFNRAARLLEEMESQGIVSAMDEQGLRQILKLPDPPDAQANTPAQPAPSAGFSLPAFDNSPIPKMDPAAADEQRRQAAAWEQKRKVRRAATRSAAWDRNPFLAFLGANGINRDVANEFAPGLVEKRKAFVPGYGPVFRAGAKNLDELVQNAKEDGFLREDDDTPELYDLIERALRGERIAPLYADGAAEAEGQRRQQEMMEREGATFEDYLQQAEADDFDPFPLMADSGYDAQDLAGTDFDQADDAVRAEVAALAAQYADMGFDPADVLEALAIENENQPEQTYYDRARTRLTDLISQAYAQAQPQGSRAVRADRPEPLPAGEAGARGPAAGQQVAPAAPTPRLRNVDELAAEGFNRVVKQGGKTYFVNPDTRESVELDSPAQIARARARVQAKQRLGSLRGTRPQDFALDAVTPEALKARDEQAQAAQAQQTAEQQAAADKAKADDERRRIEQASYAAADSFELGQNPLDSLTGQQDIFGITQQDTAPAQINLDEMRRQLIKLEDRIVGAAGLAPGFIEEAMKSRKVPAELKRERNELRDKVRAERKRLEEAARTPAAPVAADLAGERINDEWTAFDPQSGTLGIPRAEMPQIKAEHRGAMVNFLKARGIDGQQEIIPSAAIKPTQAEFSPAKVKQAMDYQGGNRSIIVSADGYVVDGHHQWLAAREKGEPIQAIRLDQNIGDVLAALKDMPSAQPEQGATSAQTYEQRNADRIARAQAADTQEAWDAITAEENADPERHFEGTDALRRAINGRRLDLKPDNGSFAIYPDRQQDDETAATDSQYPLVTHTTKKGKVLRGYIVHGMTLDEVKASIDPYALKKDGGVFVREQHKDKLPKLDGPAKPDPTSRAGQIESILNYGGYVVDSELRQANGLGMMKLTPEELALVPADKVRAPLNAKPADESAIRWRRASREDAAEIVRLGRVPERYSNSDFASMPDHIQDRVRTGIRKLDERKAPASASQNEPEVKTLATAGTFKSWSSAVPKIGTVNGWTLFRDALDGVRYVLMTPYNSVGFDTEEDARKWAASNKATKGDFNEGKTASSEQPAAVPAPQDSQAGAEAGEFDSAAFDKARNDTIQTSRDAGNTHLDQVPAYVETMRGKAIFYVHDPKVTGVIRTVDNNKNVYVDWSDAYSAEKEMASPTQDGKKTVYRSTIGPRDLKDYALAPDKREQGSQDAASQQGITADDVAAAEKQAAQMIEARIDGMKAADVQRIAARFLPTVGVKVPMGKAKIKVVMTDAAAMNLLAPAGELGIELPDSVKRALVAKMEGRVGQPTQDQADPGKINFAPSDQETGPFGPILTKFRGDAQGAIKALTELQDGEAVAALNHPEVGDIDLVWGKEGTAEKEYEDGMGLAKIIRKHSEVLDDLQEFMNSLSVQKRSQNRVILANRGGRALVRLDWDGKAKHWLLTAYDDEKKASVANGGRTGVSVGADSAPPAEQGTEADTSLSQAAQGVQAAYQANPDLEAIFDQLDGLTQRTQANGQQAAAAHPQAERIQFVQKHILDILQDLEGSGKVSINC